MTRQMNAGFILFGIGSSTGRAQGEFGQKVKAEEDIKDAGEVSFI
jgi:hypothetical protein